jgi:chromosome segregation ATPase
MISFNQPTPMPTDTTIAAALTLLQVAADPAGTKARLNELMDQMKEVHAAVAEHDAAAKKADESRAALAAVVEREKAVADRQEQLDAARLQNDNAASALAAREAKITAAEAAMAKARDEIAAREKALAVRLASYRQALA